MPSNAGSCFVFRPATSQFQSCHGSMSAGTDRLGISGAANATRALQRRTS